jgi:hypothetical protein
MNLRATMVMRLHVRVDKPIYVGRTSEGCLSIIPIVGGTFKGPDIQGEVCPGGGGLEYPDQRDTFSCAGPVLAKDLG